MRGRNRMLVALPLLALAIGLWMLVISPKREEASMLDARAAELRAQLDEQEQLASMAESAREEFPRAYRRLVVLGKAAPEDADSASLLVQLERIADKADVSFVGLEQTTDDASAAPAPAPTPQTPAQTAETQEQRAEGAEEGAPAPPPAAPATEASAALLPIGATIGEAGLPVMRYTLSFNGDFFRLADFVSGLDAMVRTKGDGTVGIRGRLITIDDFELEPTDSDDSAGGDLDATFTITTYLTPAEEGVTVGASPAGPSAAAAATPAPAPTAPPAASATPPVAP